MSTIIGASSVVRWAARKGAPAGSWLASMIARKPAMLVRVALANKMARVIWALMAKGGTYRAPVVRRKLAHDRGAVGGVGGQTESMAQESARWDRENQFATACIKARGSDLDPIHELPYGPAACELSH